MSAESGGAVPSPSQSSGRRFMLCKCSITDRQDDTSSPCLGSSWSQGSVEAVLGSCMWLNTVACRDSSESTVMLSAPNALELERQPIQGRPTPRLRVPSPGPRANLVSLHRSGRGPSSEKARSHGDQQISAPAWQPSELGRVLAESPRSHLLLALRRQESPSQRLGICRTN